MAPSIVLTCGCRVTTRPCSSTFEPRGSGNDPCLAQLSKQVEEAVVGCLIVEEAELAAARHVGDDLDRAAEIGVGVPGGGEHAEILLDQVMLVCNLRPDRNCIGELPLQRRAVIRKW